MIPAFPPPVSTEPMLVIADDQLEGLEGHPYEYDRSVADIFRSKGHPVEVYGNQRLPLPLQEALGARAWFHFNSTSALRKIPIVGAILYRSRFTRQYTRQLNDLVAACRRQNPQAVFFIPNVYWYNILAIARCFRDKQVPVAYLFRISPLDAVRVPAVMKPLILPLIRYAVGLMKKNPHIRHFSDSDVIAGEWQQHFGQPMQVLPIPHLNAPAVSGAAAPQSGKLRLYLPGGMRIEKGAELLTEAFELLCAQRRDLADRLILVTQFPGKDERLLQLKARLETLPMEQVFLGNLTTEAYNEQIGSADVILIPYQAGEGYRARTSGVLAEAIGARKPVITTRGTWMAHQTEQYGAGIVIDEEPRQLIAALEQMANGYEAVSGRMEEIAARWNAYHSKDNFYRILAAALVPARS